MKKIFVLILLLIMFYPLVAYAENCDPASITIESIDLNNVNGNVNINMNIMKFIFLFLLNSTIIILP